MGVHDVEEPIKDIEETPEISQKVKREKATYMREYRKSFSENDRTASGELDELKQETIKN